MVRYYDLVLALIPLALVGGAGILLLAGVQQPIAVSLAGTAAVGLIGHAIFVRGPVASSSAAEESTTDSPGRSGPALNGD